MPVTYGLIPEHQERLKSLYWDKLGCVGAQQLALVARLVSQAEVDWTPDAKEAMDREWKKLTDKECWRNESMSSPTCNARRGPCT